MENDMQGKHVATGRQQRMKDWGDSHVGRN